MAEKTPHEIASMLVMAHRSKLPEPEELIANTPEARRAEQKERHRPGFEDVVWFRMEIGRRQNADPRWILPLLCRRGHITRNEIGAIRIGPAETYFQIPRAVAEKFDAAVKRTAGGEGDEENLLIERSEGGPRDTARVNRKGPPAGRGNAGKPRGKHKTFHKGNDRGGDKGADRGKHRKGGSAPSGAGAKPFKKQKHTKPKGK